jgi:protein-S-isoprenylcysteine O-methyltransferase Ste14
LENIRTKTFSGFIRLALILGLLLFLPAWTVNYWLGWIYFFVFLVPCLIITLYFLKHDIELIKSRLHAGPTAEKEKNQKIIQSFTGILAIGIIVLSSLDYRFGWTRIPFYFSIISDLIMIIGFYFMFLVFKENRFTSAIIQVQSEQKVISTGAYSFVRHPMYSAGLLLFIFTPPALGSLLGLICSVLLIIFLILRTLDEEKVLIRDLKGYKEYCEKVRFRFVPYLW